MSASPIRVLVVDDSAFARKVLREVLEADAGIEVVGTARDGLEALEKIEELRPEVVVLDLVMPHLDGVGLLRALPPEGPRVIAVSVVGRDTERAVEALQLGAVDFVHKPTSLATDRLYDLRGELVAKIRLAAGVRRRRTPEERPTVRPRARGLVKGIVIGTSTGGPQALTRLLTAMPRLPIPITIALHIPADYTAALAERLARATATEVVEAADGVELLPGRVVLARGGSDLELERRSEDEVVARVVPPRPRALYVPSVDRLFASAARVWGDGALGLVLTGMGADGLEGAREIERRGGAILIESPATCVVFGMPRAVEEAGLSLGRAPIDGLAEVVLGQL